MPTSDETHTRTHRRWWIAVLIITVAGLALRVAYVWFWRTGEHLAGDALYYHQAANLLADGHGFEHPYGNLAGIDVPGADHPPLYIVYLAAFSLVGATTVKAHLLASALLGAVAIPLAAVAGRAFGTQASGSRARADRVVGAPMADPVATGRRVGLVAAVLVAVYPNTWRYDGTVMSETMVVVTVLAVLVAALWYLEAPSAGRMAVLAVALGLASLARSELLLLAVILVPLIALARPWCSGGDVRGGDERGGAANRAARPHRVAALLVGGSVAVAVIAPWPLYNLSRFDEPVLFTTNAGGTLAVANCDSVYRQPYLGYWDYSCGSTVLEREGIDPLRQGAEADGVLRREGLAYMRAHADRLPVVLAARLGRITGLYAPFHQADVDIWVDHVERPLSRLGVWTYWLVAPLAVAGGVLARKARLHLAVVVAPVVVVIVASVAFYATTRFRASAEPSLCILAAFALVAAADRGRRWRAERGSQPPPVAVEEDVSAD